MSSDYTSEEWIDAVMLPRRREVEELERYLRYIQRTAQKEGHAVALKEVLEEIEAMPKAGNNAEQLATRRIQNTLQIPYTEALALLRAAKVPEVNWGTAADVVIEEADGPGSPEVEA